MVTKGS